MARYLTTTPAAGRHSQPVTDSSYPQPGTLLLTAASVFVLVFLSLPVLALLLRAIETRGWDALPDSGISSAIAISAVTTTISAMLTVGFGTPLAFVLARWRFRCKRLVNLFIELPIVLPPAVAGLALLVTFGRNGLLGPLLGEFGVSLPFTMAAVIVAQCFVAAPFYIRSAQVGFAAVPREIEDAARVDGAHGWQVFAYVTAPIARRALVAGLILSWTRALGEFGATILFAGSLSGETQTMPLLVYNILERNLDAAIWTGVLLVALALFALALARLVMHEDAATEYT